MTHKQIAEVIIFAAPARYELEIELGPKADDIVRIQRRLRYFDAPESASLNGKRQDPNVVVFELNH